MVQPAFDLNKQIAIEPVVASPTLVLVQNERNSNLAVSPQLLVRTLAYLIDIVLIGVTTALVTHAFLYLYQSNAQSFGLSPLRLRNSFHLELFKQAVGLVVFTSYMALSLWYSNGFTYGKYLLKLKVVHENGQEVWSLGQAFLRAIAYQVSYLIFGLGFALSFIRKDKKALHDLLSKSKVVAIVGA
jgi:uncharacterized RDD family membrane protein YckC